MAEAPLTAEAFARLAGVSRETLARLTAYAGTLEKFQKTLNLIGPATLGDIWRRHFLDSAQLYLRLPETPDPLTVLDVGSGAGFPGLVLAILASGAGRPMEMHLAEVDARKCAFLREAARAAGVAVTVHNVRIEDMAAFPVNFITARAVAPLARLLELCEGFLELPQAPPVLLLLKGKTAREELTQAAIGWKMRVETEPSITEPGAMVLSVRDATRG